MRKSKCSICKEVIEGKQSLSELIGMFMIQDHKEILFIQMCPNCTVNVFLYVKDLTKDFSMLPKPKKARKKCVFPSVRKTK